jgi:hypothetical protein
MTSTIRGHSEPFVSDPRPTAAQAAEEARELSEAFMDLLVGKGLAPNLRTPEWHTPVKSDDGWVCMVVVKYSYGSRIEPALRAVG